jgi:hypothetical protein
LTVTNGAAALLFPIDWPEPFGFGMVDEKRVPAGAEALKLIS